MQPGGAGPSFRVRRFVCNFLYTRRTVRTAYAWNGTRQYASGGGPYRANISIQCPSPSSPRARSRSFLGAPIATRDGLTRPAHAESLEATGQVRRAARGGALGTSSRDRTDQDVRLRPRLCNSASRRRSSTGQSPHNSQRTLGLTHRCLLHDASFALKTSDDDRTELERPRSWRNRAAWPGHGPYHLMGLHIANGDAGRSVGAVGRLSSFQLHLEVRRQMCAEVFAQTR